MGGINKINAVNTNIQNEILLNNPQIKNENIENNASGQYIR